MRPHFLVSVLTLLVALLGPAVEQSLLAQSAGVTLIGTVTSGSAPVSHAIVAAGTARTLADSMGRFTLNCLTEGRVRVRISRLGFGRLDTTVVLRAGRPARLDAELEPGWLVAAEKEALAAEAANVAAGLVDSSALGLLKRRASDSTSSLSFGSFGARLLAVAVRGRGADSNTVLSPVSAGLALSLAFLGARTSTETALARALGMEGRDRASVERGGAALLAAARGRTDVRLEIANALWVDSGARLTPGFAASAGMWRAAVGTLRLASPRAIDPINRWGDSVTHGKISRILGEPLPDSIVMFLANAVYFKGKWLDPFEKRVTSPHAFTIGSGRRITVPAMERTGWLGYRREPGYQMVRLPYRAGGAAMYVILPDSGTALGALERRFAERGWPSSLVERDKRDVHLILPRLHVEQTLGLVPLLDSLGAGVALDCKRADFQDLAVRRASGMPLTLCIGQAAQTVYLDVDEEGTEAAAVTGIGVVGTTSVPPPPLEFIVDRPFLFVLRDEHSGAELFVGSIRKP
jgi:serpin B